MPTTDYWIRQNSLPPGLIECRDFWTDGTVRPALDIKRRHWWKWVDKYEDRSPVVAWIDDDPEAVAMLAEQGCPAWQFDQLVGEHRAGNLLPTIERGPGGVAVASAGNRADLAYPTGGHGVSSSACAVDWLVLDCR